MNDLPDVQQTKPSIEIPIQQVGVENVEVPFMLESFFGGFNDMVARVSMRTNLDSKTRGISMSRLLLTLKPYLRKPLKHFLIQKILDDFRKNLGSFHSFITFKFKLPMVRTSPISGNTFPIYYDCRFEGQLFTLRDERLMDPVPDEYLFRFFQGVRVQYASYCPCSAGFCLQREPGGPEMWPHAQRSFADVLVEVIEPNYVWLEDIISIVESAVRTLPYPIVKRTDEHEIALIAGRNELFVEDAIRAISKSLDSNEKISDWIVKCVHEESIHTSEAIAINWKGIRGGFDGTHFI